MKNKIELLSVLAVFALFAVIAVPSVSATYPANSVYFEPEDSHAQFCENTYVKIMVNARVDTTGAGMDIYFDPNCVNITNVDFTGTPYSMLAWWEHWGNYVRIGVMGPMAPIEPGIHLIANLTLHCEKEAYCTSDLLFAETELLDYDGDPLLDVTWHDGTFTCESQEKPDLEIEKSVEVGADGNFVVSYTVTNIGGGDAGPSTTCKYVDGELQETQTCPALAPGASHSDAFNPEECPCGETLNVTVCADNDDVVDESDEENNCEVNIVECIPTPPIEVDIRADGIASNIFNVADYMICPGTVTEDGVTIGNETAMGALVIYCQNNGINIHITMGTLGEYVVQIGNDPADNNSWSYAVNEEVPPVGGAQKVIVDGDRVHWYNYNLNYYSVLTSIDKTEIVVGETLTATVTWEDITGTHLLNGASVYVGAMGPWGPEPGLSVGTTGVDGTCTFSWSTVGTWGVYAVDPVHGTGIYNYPPVSFTCSTEEKPDLVVENKWETLNVDGQVIVHFIIENIGDADAGESYATLYIDDMVVETQNVLVEALGPNGRFVSEFAPEDCTPGTITVKVCADDTHMVEESDENNNCELNYFTCPLAKEPDLVVENKWEEPVDGQVIVHFIIENIGDADAGESYATLYIDDMVVETQNVLVPELGPNGRFVSEFKPEDCTEGTAITVKVCADDTHMVEESDETNNCMTNYFIPPSAPGPDLVITDIWENDGTIWFKIENRGTEEAGSSYTSLDVNGAYQARKKVGSLDSGETKELYFRYVYTPGTDDIVEVCADRGNDVAESNEGNNCKELIPGGKPDLNVSEITLNCGYLFASESNEICAKIENIGDGGAGAFNVRFDIDGFNTEVRISGLAAGANTTVCIDDTTSRTAGDSVTITVTADCDGEVTESDEENNESTLDTTVVNNGYKGKRYTGGEDINTWKTFELNGTLIYSLGDSYYLSSYTYSDWTEYNAGWTTGDLPIPGILTATIETARLFVPYTWDKAGVMPTSVGMSFNGQSQTLDAHYSDEKGWGTSYPYGMLVYDVTADFDTSGNVATLTNSCPGGGGVSMRGMLLVVVYADASEPERTIIMNEEFDLLYGGASKCTTPEEATAYAPFGSIGTTEVKATLITVAPGAGPNEGDLGFNGHMWYDVWNFVGPGTPTPQIGIAETDVTTYLQAADNEAYFQSSADYMEASNAFLILEKEEEPTPPPGPDLEITDIWNNDGTIWFKIWNRGTVEAGSSYTALYVNGAYQARKKVGSFDSGETKELYFRYVYTPGTDDIVKVCADISNDVAESNEMNNCRTVIWE